MKQDDILRKCIVTGELKEKKEMLRFTISPDKVVVPDFKKKLPGKGVWVTNSKILLGKAVEKSLFSKAFKINVKADAGLVEMVDLILHRKGLETISLARKAGVMVAGLGKASEAVKKGNIAFLLEASDAGADGHNRLMHMAKELEVLNLYCVEELDKALDKVNTVYIAFLKSEMAKTLHDELKRFQDFRNS